MSARAGMAAIAAGKLSIACTIAARYSCVRHQGFADADETSYQGKELPIIEYQNQRYRVLKNVANSYCFRASGIWVGNKMTNLSELVAEQKASSEEFQSVHIACCGMKAVATSFAHLGIEDLRKSCGGHGYLLNSGIAMLSADYGWQVSAEGDFVVLLLQVGRYLIKAYQNAKNGLELSELTSCLEPLKNPSFNPIRDGKPKAASSVAELRSHDYLIALFKYRVLVAVDLVGKRFEQFMKRGVGFEEAFNKCALGLQVTSVSFTMFFMLRNFVDVLNRQTDKDISRVLGCVVSLFALSDLLEGKQWSGLLNPDEVSMVDEGVSQILDELRPDVVSLVDAFDMPDGVLNSTIGRHDGNVYEALFEAAVNAPLNKSPNTPFKGYEELRKSLDLEFLALRNSCSPELRDDEARAKL